MDYTLLALVGDLGWMEMEMDTGLSNGIAMLLGSVVLGWAIDI